MGRSFDERDFRAALGHFCTGVVVIAALDGDPVGFACQSFSSQSLSPPLVTFSVADTSESWPRIRRSGAFCASILGADQAGLARAFGTRGTDRFAGVAWTSAPVTGSPLLTGAIAWVDSLVENVFTSGDHHIVVGRVVALSDSNGVDPLLYFRGRFCRRDAGVEIDR